MYRVAIVGPRNSVQRIMSVTEDFRKQLSFEPIIYKTATETAQILEHHYEAFDYFLFSGPIPFEIARRTGLNDEKFFSIALLETGFYKALLDITNKVGKPIDRISIDIVNTSNIIEISLSQLNRNMEKVYIESFDAEIDYHELYDYHLNLWNSGKIEAVLTCYPEVKALLEVHQIPCEWISTTKLATRNVLEIIHHQAEISFLKRTQVGVCLIHIDSILYEDPTKLSYDFQIANLKLNEEFLRLGREMNGSFINLRDGQYMIFSSRGEMLDTFSILKTTIERLERAWNRKILVGIGFGDSVLHAEMHARKALQLTQQRQVDIVLVDHEGQLLDAPKEDPSSILYEQELFEKLKREGINLIVFDRLRDAIRRKRWTTFTSKDVALELKMSERNAQRTLQSLRKANIIQQIGEEKSISKGRPSRLFQLKSDYL